MASIYGHQWTASHGLVDFGDIWRKGLHGFDHELIMHGISCCANNEKFTNWPPNLNQFRELCLNLPDRDISIQQALDLCEPANEFVSAMRKKIGSWNLAHLTYDELRPLAIRAFRECSKIYLNDLTEQLKLNKQQKQIIHA